MHLPCLLLSLALLASCPLSGTADEAIEVDVTGVLRTGLVAIGGETTGTTITAKGIRWELEFPKESPLRATAEKFHGKRVRVRGSLERRAGVEIKERWIVTVRALEAVKETANEEAEPILTAKAAREDSRIGMVAEGGKTVIDVRSESGIGSATVTRRSDTWPESICVHLHLRGLESFKLENGKLALEWSVSSSGENDSRVSLHQDGEESAIGKGSPLYSEAKAEHGYFEVPLPARLLQENPETITLRWIDFYR